MGKYRRSARVRTCKLQHEMTGIQHAILFPNWIINLYGNLAEQSGEPQDGSWNASGRKLA